jgi:hypothetical protein
MRAEEGVAFSDGSYVRHVAPLVPFAQGKLLGGVRIVDFRYQILVRSAKRHSKRVKGPTEPAPNKAQQGHWRHCMSRDRAARTLPRLHDSLATTESGANLRDFIDQDRSAVLDYSYAWRSPSRFSMPTLRSLIQARASAKIGAR